jgi:hypothetical protein
MVNGKMEFRARPVTMRKKRAALIDVPAIDS